MPALYLACDALNRRLDGADIRCMESPASILRDLAPTFPRRLVKLGVFGIVGGIIFFIAGLFELRLLWASAASWAIGIGSLTWAYARAKAELVDNAQQAVLSVLFKKR